MRGEEKKLNHRKRRRVRASKPKRVPSAYEVTQGLIRQISRTLASARFFPLEAIALNDQIQQLGEMALGRGTKRE